MVIERSDRVADVLRRDERLIEAFIAASPAFKGLRNPLMRRTMGRLATVEQAARMGGLDPDVLTERLNAALAGGNPGGVGVRPEIAKSDEATASDDEGASAKDQPGHPVPPPSSPAPEALTGIAPEHIVDVDVREDLRNGREPFGRIMEARRGLPPGGALRLRATFEPVPLYAVMAKQGFANWTEELGTDDWRVSFYPAPREASPDRDAKSLVGPATASDEPSPSDDTDDDVIVLDVRGLEPPEPMMRTLAALDSLPAGRTLLQINQRTPQFLLPKLEELGFIYEIRVQDDALTRVFIRRRDD